MSDDQMEGAVRQGVGRLQDAGGGLTGDAGVQGRGKLNEAVGAAQNAYGKFKDNAQDALGQAQDRAEDVYGEIETYVRDNPLQAVGAAIATGLLLGLLLRGGRKTIYVRK